MIFSATFVSLFLLAAVYGLLFGELSDELLARKLRISCGQIVEFKDVEVHYFYGKGAHVHIAGSVKDIENANRLAKLLRSVVDEHRKHTLNVDVEIRKTGTGGGSAGRDRLITGLGTCPNNIERISCFGPKNCFPTSFLSEMFNNWVNSNRRN